MAWQDNIHYLREAVKVSQKAREHGNTPFGAILVDADGNVILEQENIEITTSDCTGHAETALMARASKLYTKAQLWQCTLFSTAEPCAMCSGAIYWGNVGRVVYGISENSLLALTGSNEQNPTFTLPCREIFARGQKTIEVIGPVPEVEQEVLAVHQGYWK
ncbi:nucleoside deaminase [Sporomusa sp.]|jgi:tRNA(Arg) A34 adenosine deaminase TadA|uniref:nucleoside deaminase n=1 Tax=Sporomusa sp. TaxID=2078658 RepID=UPI002D017A82|nr:nucleoside deaminase [Sporomusa sp.]HWR09463.1 nucleoside deaminase [Sporomusa sp.]